MAKIIGPMLSLKAQKTFAKTMTFQSRFDKTCAYLRSQPGSKKAFTPSASQRNQRGLIGIAVIRWQILSAGEKAAWQSNAESKGGRDSGYTYFIKQAITDPLGVLGLTAYYPFNELSGATAEDVSGNGYDLTLGPSYPEDAPVRVDSVSKKLGKALKYDAVDDESVASDKVTPIGAKTIMFWVKAKPGSPTTGIFQNTQATANHGIFIWLTSGNLQVYSFKGVQGQRRYFLAGGALADGKWHFITHTWDGTLANNKAKLYEKKTQVRQQTASLLETVEPTSNLLIGRLIVQKPQWDVRIDEIRIFNRALSPAEISKHYNLMRVD